MAIITLTTDFGVTDTYVGVMKGVILVIAPEAKIVDLCHEIPPQDILAGALALESVVDYFPDETIHVAVVDPGVGGERAAVAIQTDRFTLVGPDNGLFTLALEKHPSIKAVRLTNPAYHRTVISATFHGRDIFAPVAAYLAAGVAINELGPPIERIAMLEIPRPVIRPEYIEAAVLRTDRFGNLITNLTRGNYEKWKSERAEDPRVLVESKPIGPVRQTYSDVEDGQAVAYFGSSGRLEIGIRNGNAGESLSDATSITINR